jgi:type I restriction enzyme M protein
MPHTKLAAKVRTAKRAKTANKNGGDLGFEATLWSAADTLRGSMDASEYKHPVLGLIFLKYISDAFEELHAQLSNDADSDPEDRDEYTARNVFWVPPAARWPQIAAKAKSPQIGEIVDKAMIAIERDNRACAACFPRSTRGRRLDRRGSVHLLIWSTASA